MAKIKYTALKKVLELKPEKDVNNEQAALTHYLQGGDMEYLKMISEESKETYLAKFNQNNNGTLTQELKLPITYDVPFPPTENPKFTFIDLFAGIGGFRIALQKFGGECVFSSEIDKAAKVTYDLNFGELPFGDIKVFTSIEVTDDILKKLIPDHDVLAAGFPCQPFSLAGVSARNFLGQEHGFDDGNQGNLFFDIIRIVYAKRPKVLFLENVKNLKSHDGGKTFATIKKIIEDLDYSFSYEIINSQTLVPQRRERTYMVCFDKRIRNVEFNFPVFKGLPIPLKNILEPEVDESYTISEKLWLGHQNRSIRNKARGTGFTTKEADLDKPSNTIVARYYKDGKECLIPQEGKNPRKLTPLECARLQGYPDNFIYHKSRSAAYKQFGNSVSVPVIEKIFSEIQKQFL
jgi:DNA (cytosine-5)-methyltransferase 1